MGGPSGPTLFAQIAAPGPRASGLKPLPQSHCWQAHRGFGSPPSRG
ncbi:DUF6053 domain-containing protein [Lysobacter enzymogenes]